MRTFGRPWLVSYVVLVFALVLFYQTRRHYNWDLLAYGACALVLEGMTEQEAHGRIYQLAREAAPPADFGELIGEPVGPPPPWLTPGGMAYRRDLYRDAGHFSQQLPFYRVKPLYIGAIALLDRLGLSSMTSLYALTAASFVGLAFILFLWIASRASDAAAFGAAVPLLFMAPISMVARGASPDLFAMALVAAAAFALIEGTRLWPGALLAVLTVLGRPDSVIELGLVVAITTWWRRPTGVRLGLHLGLAVVLLFEYLAVGRLANAYSWQTLFHQTVIGPMTTPAETQVQVTFAQYLRSLIDGWPRLWEVLGSAPLVVAVLGAVAVRERPRRRTIYVLLMSGALALRYLGMPGADLRLLFAPLLVAFPQAVIALHTALVQHEEARFV